MIWQNEASCIEVLPPSRLSSVCFQRTTPKESALSSRSNSVPFKVKLFFTQGKINIYSFGGRNKRSKMFTLELECSRIYFRGISLFSDASGKSLIISLHSPGETFSLNLIEAFPFVLEVWFRIRNPEKSPSTRFD